MNRGKVKRCARSGFLVVTDSDGSELGSVHPSNGPAAAVSACVAEGRQVSVFPLASNDSQAPAGWEWVSA